MTGVYIMLGGMVAFVTLIVVMDAQAFTRHRSGRTLKQRFLYESVT